MIDSPDQEPQPQDAILGGDNPSPSHAAVLGGLGPVQQRLNSSDLTVKFTAMKDCLHYGEAGLANVISFLEDPLPRTQLEAYRLLRSRPEQSVQQVLKHYKFWRHFERLDGLADRHAQMFANRQVIDFDASISLCDHQAITLGFRDTRWWVHGEQRKEESLERKLIDFLLTGNANLIEAMVFGYATRLDAHDLLLREHRSLSHLQAIFLGDIEDSESMISNISGSDLGLILAVYPNLRILHVRGDSRWWNHEGMHGTLRFSQLRHENLIALTIESGGLNQTAVREVCNLDLPSLEYLEIWLGSRDYGGTSEIEDLMPILSNEVFPNLKYLGLRNCEYSNEIAIALAQYPPRVSLIELDLSMGTLTDSGAEALLNSGILDSLTTLDVSQCFISKDFLPSLAELNNSVVCDRQRHYRNHPPQFLRYCLVGE